VFSVSAQSVNTRRQAGKSCVLLFTKLLSAAIYLLITVTYVINFSGHTATYHLKTM